MKKKRSIIIVSIIVVAVITAIFILKDKMVTSAEYSSEFNRVFGEFTAKTASELLMDKQENTCYSPVSLFAAMSLVAENTSGKTQEEVLEVLGVEDVEQLEEKYNKMIEDITEGSTDNKQIVLANSLWVKNEYLEDGSENVMNTSEEKLMCEMFASDLISANEVNSWVSDKTNGLIGNICDESSDYELALFNTVYYKSKWQKAFSKADDATFYLVNGDEVEVPYIHSRIQKVNYEEAEGYTVVNVPMQLGEMVLVLPNEEVELNSLLKENNLNDILSLTTGDGMDNGCVDITIPEFECTDNYGTDLREMLKDIGVKQLYENSKWQISEKMNGLSVSTSQSTKIIVDKDGVEAAAATAVMAEKSAGEVITPDLEIVFDRPFMYILMKDGVPLFIGTVYNPAE